MSGRKGMELLCVAWLAIGVRALPATAKTIGMVADNKTLSVTVFDADADIVLGTIALPIENKGTPVGDCTILADQTLGFVTDFQHQVWVIDLTTSPPSLAAGTNPITIVNPGEDIAITPDQRFLIVCDGGGFFPISVVEIATRTEIGTFDTLDGCNSVEVGSDGSILATSRLGAIRRFTIDGSGTLTDTGEGLNIVGINNGSFAPGATSGIVVRRVPAEIHTFTVAGMTPVDVRSLSGGFGIATLIHPAGDRVFVRKNGSPGAVLVFGFDAVTAQLSLDPSLTIPVNLALSFFGVDSMALNPSGTKLYVSDGDAVSVFDADTGDLLASITGLDIRQPTGICIVGSQSVEVAVDIKPQSCPNPLNVKSRGVLPVAILGTENFDVFEVNLDTITLMGVSPIRWDIEDVASPIEPFLGKVDCDVDCTTAGPDNIPDLMLKFDTRAVVAAIEEAEDGDCWALALSGELLDGTPFVGEDLVRIKKKPSRGRRP